MKKAIILCVAATFAIATQAQIQTQKTSISKVKATGDTIWCVASRDNDLASLLEREGYTLVRGGNNLTALFLAPEGAPVLFLGDGSRQIGRLSEEELALMERKKLRVYADTVKLALRIALIKPASVIADNLRLNYIYAVNFRFNLSHKQLRFPCPSGVSHPVCRRNKGFCSPRPP